MEKQKIFTEEEQKAVQKQRRKEDRKAFFRVLFGRGILAKVCFGILAVFVFAALLAPWLTQYSPYEQDLMHACEKPNAVHLLGTDNLGRDMLTRVLYGARISLCTGILSSIWATIIGVTLGLIAGYYGGVTGGTIMRLVDAQLSIPPLILTMCLAAVFGGSIVSISFIIGISSVPTYVRMVYGQVLSLRENDYVAAASLIGQSKLKIVFKHLMPNCFATIIVLFSQTVGAAILIEAGLAYLGVGITAPTPAWGTMVSEGYTYITFYPHMALAPGLALMLVIIALNIVGDGLRDALDPRLRGKL